MKKKIGLALIALVILLFLYLLLWPVSVEPVAFVPPEAPSLTGVYESNNRLEEAELFGEGTYPEEIAFDASGRAYVSTEEGHIIRFEQGGGDPTLFADTGGRPLGIAFDAGGNLIVADLERGLLSVAPDGSVTVLTDEAGGRPIKVANGLDIGADGVIYFSDSYYQDAMSDFFDGRPFGRLLAYDPSTQETRVLLDDLYLANGVALSPDESYVLVSEMMAYRITRYWLTGPNEGQSDIFIDNLPGFPDGITSNERDTYWVALITPRSSVIETLQATPFWRKVLMRLPRIVSYPLPPLRYGFVLGLDLEGNVVHNLQDPTGKSVSYVTTAREHEGMLYLTSPNAVKRLQVP